MKDLKELFIKMIVGSTNICPSDYDLVEYCQQDCKGCWKEALEDIDIIERGENE